MILKLSRCFRAAPLPLTASVSLSGEPIVVHVELHSLRTCVPGDVNDSDKSSLWRGFLFSLSLADHLSQILQKEKCRGQGIVTNSTLRVEGRIQRGRRWRGCCFSFVLTIYIYIVAQEQPGAIPVIILRTFDPVWRKYQEVMSVFMDLEIN